MLTLYELNDTIRKAIELGFDEETGEIFDADALEALELQRDEKIETIALFIKDLKAEAEAIKAEKRYLTKCLDGEKFKTAKVAISYRKSQTVEFIDGFDVNLLPEEYQRRVDPEADKTALKDALKAGEEIYGVYLADHNNTIIK